jgi:hypothetical protein
MQAGFFPPAPLLFGTAFDKLSTSKTQALTMGGEARFHNVEN